MFLTKTNLGSYVPTYSSDKIESDKIKIGEEVKATFPRNVKFHRKGFALLKLGFENQEKYSNFSIYRQIITMKAGFVTFAQGTDGKEYPFADSISFDKMTQDEFEKWYSAVLTIISKEAMISGKDIEENLINFF